MTNRKRSTLSERAALADYEFGGGPRQDDYDEAMERHRESTIEAVSAMNARPSPDAAWIEAVLRSCDDEQALKIIANATINNNCPGLLGQLMQEGFDATLMRKAMADEEETPTGEDVAPLFFSQARQRLGV